MPFKPKQNFKSVVREIRTLRCVRGRPFQRKGAAVRALWVCVGVLVCSFLTQAVSCGKSNSSNTCPSYTGCTGSSDCGTQFRMYYSSSTSGPWCSQQVTVSNAAGALGLVDPSPTKMPDGSILLYYLMAYNTSGDPATSQPNNQWKMGVAKSTDNGATFNHQTVAFTFGTSSTDPFPLQVDSSGTVRLYVSQGTNVVSVTASDTTGLNFSASADAGNRSTSGGVPGALKIGSTYYLYVCGTNPPGISYLTSSDGLTFTSGGTVVAAPQGTIICNPSPYDLGGGNYLMAYTKTTDPTNPSSGTVYVSSSTDGTNWSEIGQVGKGDVPGLVKDQNGVLRIYVPCGVAGICQ